MRDLLKQARPDRFEDIIALVALYRPGPMDLIPDFIARKHGKPFEYPDPRVKSVLAETYGIMVYQEQVMQMAQLIGGYSLGGADLLRRAMGKKKPEEMAQQRGIFREGAGKNGLKQAEGRRALRPDGKVRRLRLQQIARRRLRAGRLSDRVFQGASCGRVHGGQLVGGGGRHRQGQAVLRGCARQRARRAAARHQPRRIPLRAARQQDASRYGLGSIKGTGESAIAAIVAAREKERAVQGFVRFLRARRQAHRQPARDRSADARRRVRCASTITARACSPRSASRSTRPSRPSAMRSR